MTDLFDEYDLQLQKILTDIKNHTQFCRNGLSTITHEGHLAELDSLVSSAEETVRQMELEARFSTNALIHSRIDKVKHARSLLKEALENSKQMRNQLQRGELLGGTVSLHNIPLLDIASFGETNQFNALSRDDDMLNQGLLYLQTSCATANETEQVGSHAAKNLHDQRNILYNIQNKIEDTKLSLVNADEYLAKLLKQGRLNKVVLYTVFGAIICSVIIIIIIRTIKLTFSILK
ncbi:hypothetical protein BEWA_033890 [Theileria equi strain WA]|uniref:Vesicle transport v-SNARE N-terminal domain-containing protein n=1 Tax=Theileria equi strain WA TaxID=1537102 RepID=L0B074_THEEQ|nr:hypothetical protein BEWA_033890 [Theileria equi strain WA]AFZ80534.1 hypothetical protein BEWA_033890 [Theileria equi strain WA]|eukprot:XP_004830200.1 hypothetical protein BEWA_033890 [Theileria equi strain WA]